MSNVPNPGWSPSPTPANPGASLDWRIRHSWWLLLPILGCSCLGGAGFLYVGLRAKRPAWWIAGIVYLLVGWIAFILIGVFPKESVASDLTTGLVLAVSLGCIVHACLINSSWLRWRASYTPWYHQQPTAPPPTWSAGTFPPAPPTAPSYQPTSTSPAVSGMAVPTDAYYGNGPAAAPASPAYQPGQPTRPTGQPSDPLELNTATQDQLAALPGFHPERARRVVADREARRGFGSVEEFAAVAQLAPHEFAHLRSLVICVPRPPGPTSPPGQPPRGRVLDV